jgi:DUF2934 family protein
MNLRSEGKTGKIRANNSISSTDGVKSVEEPALNNYERIASLAYALYEQRGRQGGSDLDDWLEAERQVLHARR